ncbi:UDP-N-acetylmuramate--L-alanine ligase [candidate division NPL-UPA2 bacterium]|nr:UDP-N-acetylmuramate--L-alanine ligase [candidate division NPL-UPA2 bacterium]
MILDKVKKVHFIGIGGAGMSGLAEIFLERGFGVSGSDMKESWITERLKAQGAVIFLSHGEENLSKADLVVFSSAIPSSNPELKAARKRRIPLLSRGEMLAELMKEKKGIAIAGTHGKTTTTSITALILCEAALDPTIIIGGKVSDMGGSAKLGQGEYLVAEADESDGSFLKLFPQLAVITNIEAEHLDYYSSLEAVIDAFGKFVENIPPEGVLIFCSDCPNARKMWERSKLGTEILTYGLDKEADLRVEHLCMEESESRYEVFYYGRQLGEVKLQVPGKHNVCNSLAAIGVGLKVGADFSRMCSCLEKFRGVERRFEIKGDLKDIIIVDDYAHHPTEIRATLEAARSKKRERIIAVFQPHRYSRTKLLKEEFASVFQGTDVLVLTEIYSAGEKHLPGISGRALFETVRRRRQREVEFIPDKSRIADYLMSILRPGDMVITMGAGDIGTVAEEMVRRLKVES